MSMSTPLRYRRNHVPRAHRAAIPPAVPPPPTPPESEPPVRYASAGAAARRAAPMAHAQAPMAPGVSPTPPMSPPAGAYGAGSPLPASARAQRNFDRAQRAQGKIDFGALTADNPASRDGSPRAGSPAARSGSPAMPTPGSHAGASFSSPALGSPAVRSPGTPHTPTVAARVPATDSPRARAAAGPEVLADLLAASAPVSRHAHTASISNEFGNKTPVVVRLPSRKVTKHVLPELTAAELARELVREHRLEFNFEDNTVGEDDEVIVWECIDGTRRPLRATERVEAVVRRWDARSQNYLRTTSTTLRNDVDSLASLVPRRDMLRAAPELDAAAVHFSRPSVMFNPHQDDSGAPYGAPARQPAPQAPPTDDDASALRRMPSKLSPNDHKLYVRRNATDNDDVPLRARLVWGFGALTLQRGRVIVKQKPGDELVCSMDISTTDVYEWPHNGPKRYVVVLRPQSPGARAVYVCTDSARVFSVLRNAVFTARTKALSRG